MLSCIVTLYVSVLNLILHALILLNQMIYLLSENEVEELKITLINHCYCFTYLFKTV